MCPPQDLCTCFPCLDCSSSGSQKAPSLASFTCGLRDHLLRDTVPDHSANTAPTPPPSLFNSLPLLRIVLTHLALALCCVFIQFLSVSPAEERLQGSKDLIAWFMAASQCVIMSADSMDPLVVSRAQQGPKRELWEAMWGGGSRRGDRASILQTPSFPGASGWWANCGLRAVYDPVWPEVAACRNCPGG